MNHAPTHPKRKNRDMTAYDVNWNIKIDDPAIDSEEAATLAAAEAIQEISRRALAGEDPDDPIGLATRIITATGTINAATDTSSEHVQGLPVWPKTNAEGIKTKMGLEDIACAMRENDGILEYAVCLERGTFDTLLGSPTYNLFQNAVAEASISQDVYPNCINFFSEAPADSFKMKMLHFTDDHVYIGVSTKVNIIRDPSRS